MFDQQEIQVLLAAAWSHTCLVTRESVLEIRLQFYKLAFLLFLWQVLISGAQVPISLEDLKSFTNYSGMLSVLVICS